MSSRMYVAGQVAILSAVLVCLMGIVHILDNSRKTWKIVEPQPQVTKSKAEPKKIPVEEKESELKARAERLEKEIERLRKAAAQPSQFCEKKAEKEDDVVLVLSKLTEIREEISKLRTTDNKLQENLRAIYTEVKGMRKDAAEVLVASKREAITEREEDKEWKRVVAKDWATWREMKEAENWKDISGLVDYRLTIHTWMAANKERMLFAEEAQLSAKTKQEAERFGKEVAETKKWAKEGERLKEEADGYVDSKRKALADLK